MSLIAPVNVDEVDEKTADFLARTKEMLGTDDVPAMFLAYARVPAFLQDFFMNYKKFLVGDGKLRAKTRAMIAFAVAVNSGCKDWTEFFANQLTSAHGLDEQGLADIVAIAAANSMYNVFFKFRKLAGTEVFDGMGVGLRAHTFKNTSIPDAQVELIDIALSDINACEPCVQGHLQKARSLDISDEQILEAIQVASVVYSGCVFLKA